MATFLLQMAGQPGSGKSTLARLIAHSTDAIALDKDVIKTAALDAGAAEPLAGPLAYEVFFALCDSLLGQGVSVVLDSPSFWESILVKGSTMAAERIVPYFFIECVCNDQDERASRLRDRVRMRSNPGVEIIDQPWETIAPSGAYLRIDTTQPIERCLALALEYLGYAAN